MASMTEGAAPASRCPRTLADASGYDSGARHSITTGHRYLETNTVGRIIRDNN